MDIIEHKYINDLCVSVAGMTADSIVPICLPSKNFASQLSTGTNRLFYGVVTYDYSTPAYNRPIMVLYLLGQPVAVLSYNGSDFKTNSMKHPVLFDQVRLWTSTAAAFGEASETPYEATVTGVVEEDIPTEGGPVFRSITLDNNSGDGYVSVARNGGAPELILDGNFTIFSTFDIATEYLALADIEFGVVIKYNTYRGEAGDILENTELLLSEGGNFSVTSDTTRIEILPFEETV